MAFQKVKQGQSFPLLEEEVLKGWKNNRIFEKSVEGKSLEKTFSFYDGPPFATGTPHYGHLLAGTIKDVIPRFKTMQGYRVERIWGWDTHGLPIENIVEQELDFKSKLQIEEFGVDKFNELCRSKVLGYAEEWKEIVARTGRWVDMENAYLTMNPEYMESVWWVFSELYKKGLTYEGHKVMPYCPRCSTPLSNFEVGQGYKDKRDKAATIKFEKSDEPGTYFLAWTTTPWTLPGNLALAVGPKIEYSKVKTDHGQYILATERLENYSEFLGDFQVVETFTGKELVGLKYKPVFDFYKDIKKAFIVIDGDHVTTEDGTGIVHTAPAFGEEDYNVGKKHGIDFFMPVDDLGKFTIEVTDYAGQDVITLETNEKIIKDLGDKVARVETITHSYPHCWRCETPLIYRGVASWFVAVEKIKDQILANNAKIYWLPESVGKGRFAKLIENAPDWSVSRNRFWGTPLPVWKCDKCHKIEVLGSIAELEKKSGVKVTDIHLHKIQNVGFNCDCGGSFKLSGEVFDCWFESGSMPYGSIHYPFENEHKFKHDFPADFIAEGIDQTRGWFYSLIVLATAIFGESSYKSVIVNGTVLTENGQKMSKRLQNYPDPMEIVDKYGADALRFALMSSPAVKAEDMRFSEKGVDEVVKKIILTLWNSYSFFVTYANIDDFTPTNKLKLDNPMDYWIVSETNQLIRDVTMSFEAYDLSRVARQLTDFIDDLSNWYIRRSRRRFWKSENDTDKSNAYETLYYVLVNYTKLLAPFMPFVTDHIYQNLVLSMDKKAPESIHLSDWPVAEAKLIDLKVNEQIHFARKIVEKGLKLRAKAGINVRQPIQMLLIFDILDRRVSREVLESIKEELNVKNIEFRNQKNPGENIVVSVLTTVNFKTVGPRLGEKTKLVAQAFADHNYKIQNGKFLVLDEELTEEEVARKLDVDISGLKDYVLESENDLAVAIDTKITQNLHEEGLTREFVRKIQDARKQAGYDAPDHIEIYLSCNNPEFMEIIRTKWAKYIMHETMATKIGSCKSETTDFSEEVVVDKVKVWFGVKRAEK
jgi:isoleucyl-tRNA synthetase